MFLLATLILSPRDHDAATAALERVRESPTTAIQPNRADFEWACEEFARYDDHEMSFTDHMSGVLAADREIEDVFTFDPDHFRTLEFTAVPDDTGEGF